MKIRVWLDGEEQRGVVRADTRTGELQRHIYEPGSNMPKLTPDRSEVVVETVRGKVEVQVEI